jgi:hypothetical protein
VSADEERMIKLAIKNSLVETKNNISKSISTNNLAIQESSIAYFEKPN